MANKNILTDITVNGKITSKEVVVASSETNLLKVSNEIGEDYITVSQNVNNKATVSFGDVDEQFGTMFFLNVEDQTIQFYNNGVISIGDNGFGNNAMLTIDDDNGKMTMMEVDVGINTLTPKAKLDVKGGIRMANDTSVSSSVNVGTMRYRTDRNGSYMDMCMQTGTSTYRWINIVQNNY